jgi:hypothetical protein
VNPHRELAAVSYGQAGGGFDGGGVDTAVPCPMGCGDPARGRCARPRGVPLAESTTRSACTLKC